MANPDVLEPLEEQYTQWHNPLDVEQRVDIYLGDSGRQATRFKIPPGKTVPIPSRHDYAIHRVHNGVIIGGLAPQLVKVGSEAKLDPVLDTEAEKKRKAEVDASMAALRKQQADDAIITATAKAAEADKTIRSRSKPLPPELAEKKSEG